MALCRKLFGCTNDQEKDMEPQQYKSVSPSRVRCEDDQVEEGDSLQQLTGLYIV